MKLDNINQKISVPLCWNDMIWGKYFRKALNYNLQPYLYKIYGFHMIKIGNLSSEINTTNCPISHQVNIGSIINNNLIKVIAKPILLPFRSKSIDACLIIHTLTWSKNPHRILREIDRVLIDNGWIIISEFNPFSLLGISKVFPFLRNISPWNAKMFSKFRIIDWLNILNYEVIYKTCFQIIPWKYNIQKKIFLIKKITSILGCINLIIARKRTFCLISKIENKEFNNKHYYPIANAHIKNSNK